MSDTEDDAADGDSDFDKEAERERLREKYERDQKRREATQRMSELLLKGATMTDTHCDNCGSPLFRHDGEVFCPTCQGTRQVEQGDDAAGDDQSGAARAGSEPESGATPESEPEAVPGAAGDEGDHTPGDVDAGRAEEPDLSPGRSLRPDPSEVGAAPSGTDGEPGRAARGPPPHEASVEEAPSLAQAKASLRRAIVSLSEQAAQTDDPGRATALLEGTREAAEALAALEGAGD